MGKKPKNTKASFEKGFSSTKMTESFRVSV